MDTIELSMDRELFSLDVVARTAHRYSQDYFVELASELGLIRVRLSPKRPDVDTSALPQRFRNDALDDRLRAKVTEQTGELHSVLIRAALVEAQPRQFET